MLLFLHTSQCMVSTFRDALVGASSRNVLGYVEYGTRNVWYYYSSTLHKNQICTPPAGASPRNVLGFVEYGTQNV